MGKKLYCIGEKIEHSATIAGQGTVGVDIDLWDYAEHYEMEAQAYGGIASIMMNGLLKNLFREGYVDRQPEEAEWQAFRWDWNVSLQLTIDQEDDPEDKVWVTRGRALPNAYGTGFMCEIVPKYYNGFPLDLVACMSPKVAFTTTGQGGTDIGGTIGGNTNEEIIGGIIDSDGEWGGERPIKPRNTPSKVEPTAIAIDTSINTDEDVFLLPDKRVEVVSVDVTTTNVVNLMTSVYGIQLSWTYDRAAHTREVPHHPFYIRWIGRYGGYEHLMLTCKQRHVVSLDKGNTYQQVVTPNVERTAGIEHTHQVSASTGIVSRGTIEAMQSIIYTPLVQMYDTTKRAWVTIQVNKGQKIKWNSDQAQGEVELTFNLPND